MALGNDLDAKIDVIYNQYLSKQNDEKLADRVLTSKESFKEGLEEVIKINNIVDKNVFFDAILVEIKNGNFSISNDGKIDLNSESVNKAVIRAKEEEQKDREFRAVVETESKKDNLSEYKDLLEIKEVKSLEEAKRIVSMDVPNEVFDQIDPEVKKAAFKTVYEQMMDSERAEAMADIAVNPPKTDSLIDEEESDKIFTYKEHSKAFVGFYNTCFDDINLIKKYAEGCKGLAGYDWNDPEQKKAGLAEIFTTLCLIHVKEGMGESFLEGYTKLSELTDEQRAAYKKLEPLYIRNGNIHDARLVTMILSRLENSKDTKEQLREAFCNMVRESEDWELTPEMEAAIQEVVDNPQIFMEVADKTVERKKQENKVNEYVYNVQPSEFADMYNRYIVGFNKTEVLDRDDTLMGVDNGIRLNEMSGEARKVMRPGDIERQVKHNKQALSEIIHTAQQIHGISTREETPPVQHEGDEMDAGFDQPITDNYMSFVVQTQGEEMVVGDAKGITNNYLHQFENAFKGFTIQDKGNQGVHDENTFDATRFTEVKGFNYNPVNVEDKTKVLQEEKKNPSLQVEEVQVDKALVEVKKSRFAEFKESLPMWMQKAIDNVGKFFNRVTGKNGENNTGTNNTTTTTSSNAGQNKPVQEFSNFVPTAELNLKQAQQATKAAEEAKKNNDARGTDEPTQDDSEIGE